MAREYAQLRLDLEADDDFRDLSPAAQHLYYTLLRSSKLTAVGVTDWRPARIKEAARGWTPAQVNAAGAELAHGLLIVVDEGTEEVLIRSHIKHDKVVANPKTAISMVNAYRSTASRALRAVIVYELRKLAKKQPGLAGWKDSRVTALLERSAIDPAGFPTGFPQGSVDFGGSSWEPVTSVTPTASPKPSPNSCPSDTSSDNPNGSPVPEPVPEPTTPDGVVEISPPSTPKRARASAPAGFDRFWALYPLKKDAGAAKRAFTAALRKTDLDTILAAVQRYRDDPNREPAFTKYPATWLNAEAWTDTDPLPARGHRMTTRERQFAEAGEALQAALARDADDESVDPLALLSNPFDPEPRQLGA
ncbi:hypothetical protein [Nocardia transvalensis]|uniref:hypothetical protein n=1 Tax=Nocardia transvalensis TaxID=37333 RepID=UPI001894E8FF|nr:hypothetical protein [Nocardia transvalensis]MBF6332312.1 hypothetical protein [Nocardia transvalensis]